MENIVFRAVVVLSVLGVLIGSSMSYFGSGNADFWWQQYHKEMEKHGSKELDNCLNAIRENDGNRVKFCYNTYGSNVQLLQLWSDNARKSYTVATVGFILSCVVPPLLFALFFVVRWILTGRWKKGGSP